MTTRNVLVALAPLPAIIASGCDKQKPAAQPEQQPPPAVQDAPDVESIDATGQGVLWHNEAGDTALLWNFAERTVSLTGQATDLTTGQKFPEAAAYRIQPQHTYQIEDDTLPTNTA